MADAPCITGTKEARHLTFKQRKLPKSIRAASWSLIIPLFLSNQMLTLKFLFRLWQRLINDVTLLSHTKSPHTVVTTQVHNAYWRISCDEILNTVIATASYFSSIYIMLLVIIPINIYHVGEIHTIRYDINLYYSASKYKWTMLIMYITIWWDKLLIIHEQFHITAFISF